MASPDDIVIEITPQVLLKAYTCGIFPMAEAPMIQRFSGLSAAAWRPSARNRTHPQAPRPHPQAGRCSKWHRQPTSRALISGCAASRPGRRSTWINPKIRSLYRDLFEMGYCHTVETWKDGQLVGGLYGVALAGAYFGESMFSTERDAQSGAHLSLCASALRRLLAARHAVRHRASAPVRYHRDRARRVHTCAWKRRSNCAATSWRFQRMRHPTRSSPSSKRAAAADSLRRRTARLSVRGGRDRALPHDTVAADDGAHRQPVTETPS